jgi:hypothetical protein
MRIDGFRCIAALTGVLLALGPLVVSRALAQTTDLDLVCDGNQFAKLGDPSPTPVTASLRNDGKKTIAITLPGADKPISATIISSNPIQLKFSAAGLTGEYFNFSGDLFLIHKDGRFTKLGCRPKE